MAESHPAPRNGPSLLIVEDDEQLRRLLFRAASRWGFTVSTAATVKEAVDLLPRRFDALVLDVRLPDGSGVEVAEWAAEMRPLPAIVTVTGASTRAEAFRLAQLGVREFIEKPFSAGQLHAALQRAMRDPPPIQPHVAGCLGRVSLPLLQQQIREAMFADALAASEGNLTQAARLLGVSRQAIQKVRRQ